MPVQFHRATEDPFVPAPDVERFAETLRILGTPIEVFTYQARHGFVASNRGVYDSASARLAWSRVRPFLQAQVGKPIRRRAIAPPRTSDTSQMWRQLERRYAEQDSAIARRDLAGFLATLSPAYFVELRNGQRFTRPGIDSAIARDMRLTQAVRDVGTVIESLTIRGDTLVATVMHRADRTLADGQGRPQRWENIVRHEETWVRTDDAWYIVALRERQQLHLRRDGVPITQ